VGLALVLATCWTGVGARTPGDPLLVSFRIGVVVLCLGLLELVPAGAARLAAPLGRSSLGVYAIHLPIVYGWSAYGGLAWYFGPAGKDPGSGLSGLAALGVAAAVLAASFALWRALVWAAGALGRRLRALGRAQRAG
jgi:hypothetical protein